MELRVCGATAIAAEWSQLVASRPEPAIFWGFIDATRNAIVKNYRLSAGQGVTVRPGAPVLNLNTGESWGLPSGPTTYSYTLNDGPFAGRDQREVVAEAISWWEEYLARVDARMGGSPRQPNSACSRRPNLLCARFARSIALGRS
jgi:hypothetical protein